MSDEKLKAGIQAFRKGKLRDARRLFRDVVQNDPDNGAAWWYLANSVDDVNQQIDCLRQVLRIRPDHPEANAMLNQLQRRAAQITPPGGTQRPTVEAVDAATGLLAVVPDEAEEDNDEVVQAPPGASDVTVAIVAVLVAMVAMLGAAILAFTGGSELFTTLFGVSSPELEPTRQPLAFDAPACSETTDGPNTLIFINNTTIPLEILGGEDGFERNLTSVAAGQQASIEAIGQRARYVVWSDSDLYASDSLTIEFDTPNGVVCRIPLRQP
ncbi:MAG: tetratricopeptide repeat protein [Chloroflexi bacterium]|nr:tetratricopeptide repeat protein [Chloroflexota bacterium]